MVEEPMEVMYSQRSNLHTITNSKWKENGFGIVKLMKHKGNGSIQFIMQHEKTKMIMAHFHVFYITDLRQCRNLQPTAGIDKCWGWTAQDMSENPFGPPVTKTFGLQFDSAEMAVAFKVAFGDAKVRRL